MSTNPNANTTQTAGEPTLDAAQPAGPHPIRRSTRISNKVVKSTKGTCGEVAERVSLTNRSDSLLAGIADDERHDLSQPSKTITVRQPHGNGIIYVTETVLQQYVRVTVRGHTMEDNSWCSNCRNGGYLIVCSSCNERAFCNACLEFSTEGDDSFLCPICYYKKAVDASSNKRTKYDPYPYTFCQAMSTRENFAKVLLEPIAVISIHLRGWPVYETPASVAYESLVSWLKGNVVLIEIDFDFTTSTTKKNFTARLNKLLGEFRSGGPLEKFTRFSIYLSTHSDPFSGDLHIGPTPSCGASPIDEVFDILFPPTFQALLRRHPRNMLNLMACGAVSNVAESNKAVQHFSNKSFFSHIYAYTQSDFQPSLTFPFCQRLMVNFFIYGRDSVHTALQDSQSLGSHTGLMEFTPSLFSAVSNTSPRFFAWSHASRSPMGTRVKPQCECKRLDTISITTTDQSPFLITHRCTAKDCRATTTYTLPDGADWIGGYVPGKSSHGNWFVMPWLPRTADTKQKDAQ